MTKREFERNFYQHIQDMNKARKEGNLEELHSLAKGLLEDQKGHDELQLNTIGYGVNAPTHYEATKRMLFASYGIEL